MPRPSRSTLIKMVRNTNHKASYYFQLGTNIFPSILRSSSLNPHIIFHQVSNQYISYTICLCVKTTEILTKVILIKCDR
jgi:hypothetical protein